MCACVCRYCKGQQRALYPLNLELKGVVSSLTEVLGTKLRSPKSIKGP